MNVQSPEIAEKFVNELHKQAGAWPRTAALEDEFGFRVYGYGRSPTRVWIWFAVTTLTILIAGWIGWSNGGKAGEELFDFAYADLIGQLIFSSILIAGSLLFLRKVVSCFLEKIIEPRFEVILTKDAIEIGGWFGCKEYTRTGFIAEFTVEPHEEAASAHHASSAYIQTLQVVLRYAGLRIPITSICRDIKGVEALHWRLRAFDEFIRQTG